LAAFDGTVIAVTHDRWFARTFTRFLVFGVDGKVKESVEPQWV
jgi:ATPase subunit of ABC transporter with duplicated ATPase domains